MFSEKHFLPLIFRPATFYFEGLKFRRNGFHLKVKKRGRTLSHLRRLNCLNCHCATKLWRQNVEGALNIYKCKRTKNDIVLSQSGGKSTKIGKTKQLSHVAMVALSPNLLWRPSTFRFWVHVSRIFDFGSKVNFKWKFQILKSGCETSAVDLNIDGFTFIPGIKRSNWRQPKTELWTCRLL